MGKMNIYKNDRPILTIQSEGGRSLGNCYSAHFYRITSLSALSKKDMRHLRDAGLIGYGQEYIAEFITHEGVRVPLPEVVNWQNPVVPSGLDEVPCVEVDDQGKVLGPGINPYSKEPYAPTKIGYYVYLVGDRVDSSD
jgi:hypothetical protein